MPGSPAFSGSAANKHKALKDGKAKDLAEELEKQECELQRSGTSAGIQATESQGKCDWQAALLKKKELVQPVPESGATGKPNLTPEAADKTDSAKQLTPEVSDIPPQSVNKLTAMFENLNTGKISRNASDEPRKQNQRQNPSGGDIRPQTSSTRKTTNTSEVNVSVHVKQISVTQPKCLPDDSKEEPSSLDSFPEDIEPQAPYPTCNGEMAHPHNPVNIIHSASQCPYPTGNGLMPQPDHTDQPYQPGADASNFGFGSVANDVANDVASNLPATGVPYPTGSGPMPQPDDSSLSLILPSMPQADHSSQPYQPSVDVSALGFGSVANDVTNNLPAAGMVYPADYDQLQIPDNNTSQSLHLPPPSFP
ncbi:hypothetical protein LSAT2_003359 [Lamellibrachia satsuma]|nr:hypothetical protein LSAT2_003359 [Lamellibrachia satsuma]